MWFRSRAVCPEDARAPWIFGGGPGVNTSPSPPTRPSDTVSMAVRIPSVDGFALATVAKRPDKAGGPPPQLYELRDNLFAPIDPVGSGSLTAALGEYRMICK